MFADRRSCTSQTVLNQPINKNEYAIGSYICVGLVVVVVRLANLTPSESGSDCNSSSPRAGKKVGGIPSGASPGAAAGPAPSSGSGAPGGPCRGWPGRHGPGNRFRVVPWPMPPPCPRPPLLAHRLVPGCRSPAGRPFHSKEKLEFSLRPTGAARLPLHRVCIPHAGSSAW